MNISVNRNLKTPIYMQIALQIKTKIFMNEICHDSVLPSERQLADMLSVHRNTVVRAYNELESEGLVQSRPGSCYRVCYEEGSSIQGKVKSVNWENIIKEENLTMENSFDEHYSKTYTKGSIPFAGGVASPDIYSKRDIVKSIEEAIMQDQHETYFYAPYQGDFALRNQLVKFMRTKGVLLEPSEIQIFSETNQASDFIISMLLRPGDTVITEEPVSPDLHRALRLAGANHITVPVDEDGMICSNLGPLIEKHRPKMIYVSSSYQDPTGSILSVERRHKILEYSYKYRIPIVEEDAASLLDLDENVFPSIKSMDKAGNVIYIYSFSLTLIPGINVAFVAAPKELIKSLRHLVAVRLVSVGFISQKLLEYYLRNGVYMAGVKRIKKEYQQKMELMYEAISEANIEGLHCTKPRGGVYVWCHLPDCVDSRELAEELSRRGVNIIPGDVFFPSRRGPENYIRLNYSLPDKQQIVKGMTILINTVREMKSAHEKRQIGT